MTNGLALMYDHSGRMTNADRVEAWKAMGFDAAGCRTAAEALEMAGLNFRVEARRPFAPGGEYTETDSMGAEIVAQRPEVGTDEYKAWVRIDPDGTEQILSFSGPRYKAIQPQLALGTMDDIVDEAGGAHYDAIGWIEVRKALFATLKLDRSLIIDPQGAADQVDYRLFGFNDYKGNSSFTVGVTGTRAWCTNQVTGIVRKANRRFCIRHSGNLEKRVADARKALNLTTQYLDEFDALATALYAQRMPQWKFDKLVDEFLPVPFDATEETQAKAKDQQEAIQFLFREGEANANIRGTSWAAFNAFTEYLDWVRPTRAAGEKGQQARALGTTLGNEARLRDKVLATLTAGVA